MDARRYGTLEIPCWAPVLEIWLLNFGRTSATSFSSTTIEKAKASFTLLMGSDKLLRQSRKRKRPQFGFGERYGNMKSAINRAAAARERFSRAALSTTGSRPSTAPSSYVCHWSVRCNTEPVYTIGT